MRSLGDPPASGGDQLTDLEREYREGVEQYSIRGGVSPAGRVLLNTLRVQLGLTLKEAAGIEDQVLQLARKKIENIKNYQAAFVAEIRQEYPLSREALKVLENLREILELKKEDVTSVEDAAIIEKEKLNQLRIQATLREADIKERRGQLTPIENQLIEELDSDLHLAINWISSQKDILVERACREIQKDSIRLSEQELNDFSFQLGQYLTLIRRAIVARSNNLLQEPHPPLIPNIDLYVKALEFVTSRIPEDMSDVARTELKVRLDYLKGRL